MKKKIEEPRNQGTKERKTELRPNPEINVLLYGSKLNPQLWVHRMMLVTQLKTGRPTIFSLSVN